ncbi:uncharacterized protein [Rutidosis leptorrhynchoides]|uniref:uncharacterized protein n=1 Tax=Rutidosis leptorrhynchoides TaxID=125765 RepID=UPI003A99CF72
MWARVLKALHGNETSLDGKKLSCNGIWNNIVCCFEKVKYNGILPSNVLRMKICDGFSIRLWKNNWLGSGALKDKYGRLYHLEVDENCLLADRCTMEGWRWSWNRELSSRNKAILDELMAILSEVHISSGMDKWHWGVDGEDGYAVNTTRRAMDEILLPSNDIQTRWIKSVPRKINIFLWRLALDRLPARQNLNGRGIDIEDVGFVSCTQGIESISHVMFDCSIAEDLLRKARIWIGYFSLVFTNWAEVLSWVDD